MEDIPIHRHTLPKRTLAIVLSLSLFFGGTSSAFAGGLFSIDSTIQAKVNALGSTKVTKLPIPVFGINVGDFGDSWGDPRSGGRSHEGTDILAPNGQIIVSPTDAVVTKVGYNDLGGNYVVTANPGNEFFYYAHLDDFALGLKKGYTLKKGDIIGYVGGTGNAYGNDHLHLEIHSSGTPINPFPRFSTTFSREDIAYKMFSPREINFGYTNKDVQFLQQFLIVENSGPKAQKLAVEGASGYFGNLTKEAVIEFQERYGIEPAEGHFGPLTQEQVVSLIDTSRPLLAQLEVPEQKLAVAEPTGEVSGATSSDYPAINLELGDTGSSVTALQKYLIAENAGSYAQKLASEGATGYFGNLTQSAVIELQNKYGVEPASGYYGSLTRQALAGGVVVEESAPTQVAVVEDVAVSEEDLEVGAEGEAVVALQESLIAISAGPEARRLAEEGATGYFGPMTQDALIEYQLDNGIWPAEGYYGELTRRSIRQDLGL